MLPRCSRRISTNEVGSPFGRGSPWGGVNTKISAGMQAELTRYEIFYKSNMMLGYRQ